MIINYFFIINLGKLAEVKLLFRVCYTGIIIQSLFNYMDLILAENGLAIKSLYLRLLIMQKKLLWYDSMFAPRERSYDENSTDKIQLAEIKNEIAS